MEPLRIGISSDVASDLATTANLSTILIDSVENPNSVNILLSLRQLSRSGVKLSDKEHIDHVAIFDSKVVFGIGASIHLFQNLSKVFYVSESSSTDDSPIINIHATKLCIFVICHQCVYQLDWDLNVIKRDRTLYRIIDSYANTLESTCVVTVVDSIGEKRKTTVTAWQNYSSIFEITKKSFTGIKRFIGSSIKNSEASSNCRNMRLKLDDVFMDQYAISRSSLCPDTNQKICIIKVQNLNMCYAVYENDIKPIKQLDMDVCIVYSRRSDVAVIGNRRIQVSIHDSRMLHFTEQIAKSTIRSFSMFSRIELNAARVAINHDGSQFALIDGTDELVICSADDGGLYRQKLYCADEPIIDLVFHRYDEKSIFAITPSGVKELHRTDGKYTTVANKELEYMQADDSNMIDIAGIGDFVIVSDRSTGKSMVYLFSFGSTSLGHKCLAKLTQNGNRRLISYLQTTGNKAS